METGWENFERGTAQNSWKGTGMSTGTTGTGTGNNFGNITVAVKSNNKGAFDFATEVQMEVPAGTHAYDDTIYDACGADRIVQIKEDGQPLAAIYVASVQANDRGQVYFQLDSKHERYEYIRKIDEAYKKEGYKFLIVGYGTANGKLPDIKELFYGTEPNGDDINEYTNYPARCITFTIGPLVDPYYPDDKIAGPTPVGNKTAVGFIRKVCVKDIIAYIKFRTSMQTVINNKYGNITVAVKSSNNSNAAFNFATEVKNEISAGTDTYDDTIYNEFGDDKIVQIRENGQPLAAIYVASVATAHGQVYFQLIQKQDSYEYIRKIDEAYKKAGYKFLIAGYGAANGTLPDIKEYFFSTEPNENNINEYVNYPANCITFTISSLVAPTNLVDQIAGPVFVGGSKTAAGLIRKVSVKDIVSYIKSRT